MEITIFFVWIMIGFLVAAWYYSGAISRPPVTVVVRKRGDRYSASIENLHTVPGCSTPDEAVGVLIRAYPEKFNAAFSIEK